ncbi:hypothetical protein C1752_10578 [Acaryochloris thomasi RCC1774]|uniref:Uncharacterized protein n=1 Tax=Acaryochloris thomasi RCC1774 TaxID=1764569 RepID=A0A2W1JMR4_9CYAN|nr:hypothetical protein [Acaryochloris thomasi]PZD70571.1 hypothetical protein C1752_10578 [Acaryochloris thomasi RCC1774]
MIPAQHTTGIACCGKRCSWLAVSIGLVFFLAALSSAKPAQASFTNGAESFFSEAFPEAKGFFPFAAKAFVVLSLTSIALSSSGSDSTNENS